MKYEINQTQLKKMASDPGFIAALDQSGGSTPKALRLYGIPESEYKNDEEMFDLVHAMRTRIIKSPSFNGKKIVGAILFEMTMDRKIDDKFTADYLWEEKGIIPFLKIDKGLDELEDGVQLMKPIPGFHTTLTHARERHIFGTKMRSVIKKASATGIEKVVKQQFEFAKQIISMGLVPIIEPEVDINIPDKKEAEEILKASLIKHTSLLSDDQKIMFKLSLPTVDNLYKELMDYPCVVRVVALSGGYSRDDANKLLAKNHGVIASFSRALSEGLNANQSQKEFDDLLASSVNSIYEASVK